MSLWKKKNKTTFASYLTMYITLCNIACKMAGVIIYFFIYLLGSEAW